jgi:hypothetical protein
MASKKATAAPMHEIVRRKEELLDRYRAERLEEMLRKGRAQAVEEAERGRFAWRGEFRPREEILYWYGQGRRWDRRFMLDSRIVVVVLVAIVMAFQLLVKIMLPDPNFTP